MQKLFLNVIKLTKITKITYSINIFFAKTVVSHVKLFLTNLVN